MEEEAQQPITCTSKIDWWPGLPYVQVPAWMVKGMALYSGGHVQKEANSSGEIVGGKKINPGMTRVCARHGKLEYYQVLACAFARTYINSY